MYGLLEVLFLSARLLHAISKTIKRSLTQTSWDSQIYWISQNLSISES